MKKFSYKKYADWCAKKGFSQYDWGVECDNQIIDKDGFVKTKFGKYWVDSNDWCIEETEVQDKPSLEEELLGRTGKKPEDASASDLIHTAAMALMAAGYDATECVNYLYEIMNRGIEHGRH